MKYTNDELAVLNKLGIESFREVTKDSIVQFASMIPNMDKEVAVKAIEQIPNLTSSIVSAVTEYKDIAVNVLDLNDGSSQRAYDEISRLIDVVEYTLSRDDITSEERYACLNCLSDLSEKISDIDNANKDMQQKIIKSAEAVVTITIIAIGSIFGLNKISKKPS